MFLSLFEPNPSTIMLSQSTRAWSHTGISPSLKQPWYSLPFPHKTLGRSSFPLLKNPLEVFFPLVLFSVCKKVSNAHASKGSN